MNIYAKAGHKVIVTEATKNNGYNCDKEALEKYLKIGVPYEVQKTNVGDWHTSVFLVGFTGIAFNSVSFEDYEPTPIEKPLEGEENIKEPVYPSRLKLFEPRNTEWNSAIDECVKVVTERRDKYAKNSHETKNKPDKDAQYILMMGCNHIINALNSLRK